MTMTSIRIKPFVLLLVLLAAFPFFPGSAAGQDDGSGLPYGSDWYRWGDDPGLLPRKANFGDVNFENALNADEAKTLQERGWSFSNSDDGFTFTAPVRSYFPNAWGLYNMHGNVSEMCRDDLSPSTEYSLCGGSLLESEQKCVAEERRSVKETQRGFYVGFRVVLTESQPDPDSRFQ